MKQSSAHSVLSFILHMTM